MPTVRKSVLVERSAQEMFALVEDVESYPAFLPWCSGAQVLERSTAVTVARIDIDYRGLTTSFTTRNRKTPPTAMQMELEEGPFDALDGMWKFKPLSEHGCRVDFTLEYKFSSAAVGALFAPVFGHIVATIVDHFVARAGKEP
jgi:ribosome-associated toxin RatA of RatAB toxin-antitoxin module